MRRRWPGHPGWKEEGRNSVPGSESSQVLLCQCMVAIDTQHIWGAAGGLCGYRMPCEMGTACGASLGSSRVLSVEGLECQGQTAW